MEQAINFAEAALGADIQVPTLEGNVTLTIPAGVQNGAKFRMKGKGVKSIKGYGKGDQYVTVKVVTPKNLSPEQKELDVYKRQAMRRKRHATTRGWRIP